jgi:hypothetical protein
MSSTGVSEGAGAGGPDGSSGRKRGRSFGSRNKVKDPAATPSVPRKRGRPLGSRNKKTLAALAAGAAADSAGVAPAAAAAAAPTGAVVTAAATAAAPAEAATSTALVVTPIEVVAAIIGAAILVGLAPPGFAGAGVGGSTSATATVVYKPQRPPARQRLFYTSEHGFTTFVAHLRAGCEVRLLLPFRFVDTLGKNPLRHAMVEEGSGGQPLYPVELYHDAIGKSYLRDGWPKFFKDYDLEGGLVPHLHPPHRVALLLRPRRRHLWLCPHLLPLAVTGERPQGSFFDGCFVSGRLLELGVGAPLVASALSVAFLCNRPSHIKNF